MKLALIFAIAVAGPATLVSASVSENQVNPPLEASFDVPSDAPQMSMQDMTPNNEAKSEAVSPEQVDAVMTVDQAMKLGIINNDQAAELSMQFSKPGYVFTETSKSVVDVLKKIIEKKSNSRIDDSKKEERAPANKHILSQDQRVAAEFIQIMVIDKVITEEEAADIRATLLAPGYEITEEDIAMLESLGEDEASAPEEVPVTEDIEQPITEEEETVPAQDEVIPTAAMENTSVQEENELVQEFAPEVTRDVEQPISEEEDAQLEVTAETNSVEDKSTSVYNEPSSHIACD